MIFNLLHKVKLLIFTGKSDNFLMKHYPHIFFICFILLLSFGCSKTSNVPYPEPLAKAITYFYNENENEKVTDELNKLNPDESSEEVNGMAQLFRAAALCETEKVDSAFTLLKSIKPLPKNPRFMFWHNSIRGLILFRQNELLDSHRALAATTTSDYKDTRALALNERILARISFLLSDQTKGIEWLTASSQHFEESGLIKSTGINLKILGRYHLNNRNYAKALQSFRSAENIFIKYNDKAELFYIYINFMDYCLVTKQLKAARYYANKSVSESNEIMDNSMRALAYNNLAEIEMTLENYDTAIHYLNHTLEIPANYSTFNIRRVYAHIKLSDIYLQKKDTLQAHQQLLAARRSLPVYGYLELRHQTYARLAKTYKAINNIKSAYTSLDTAKMYLDSTFYSLTNDTKTFYDTKNELTKSAYNLENFKTTKQRNDQINLLVILGLIVLAAFVLIIYRQQREKNKVLSTLVQKNIRLVEEERKLRQTQQAKTKQKNGRKTTEVDNKYQQIYEQLIQWLETDKNFSRKELTLDSIAKELNTNREYLSRAISEQSLRFNDLINKYRVDEVISILSDPTNHSNKYNLAVIGNQAGFNSNSVFIEAFRKQTGMNPAQFRENIENPARG